MEDSKKITLILTLLILESILTFIRNAIYIGFDKNFLNIDENIFGKPNDIAISYILTLFAAVRLVTSGSVLYLRPFRFDLLTVGLLYLVFSSLVRFYHQYLINKRGKKVVLFGLDKYDDINTLILSLVSGYIVMKIFFYSF